ncbi:hypothetical protein BDW75DRAFT_242960 [Aspergillus navahoensis]
MAERGTSWPTCSKAGEMRKRYLCSQVWFPLVLELGSTAIFVVTAWIAQTTHAPPMTLGGFTVDASSTLTLLSVLQGLHSVLATFVLSSLFEFMHWTLTARDSGLTSIGLLGLSPTTGALGSVRIIFSKNCRLPDRLWPLLRLTLTTALWASGIIVFADTDIGVAYVPVFDYEVTAGIGHFNGSYVGSYIELLQDREREAGSGYPYTVVPYWMQAVVNNLVTSPMHSIAGRPVPVGACIEHECDSYLLPGGLIGASPWPPTEHPSAPVVRMDDAPSVQLDFAAGLRGHSFSEDDCTVFGGSITVVGIRFCVAESQTVNGSFAAGLYVCPSGAYNGTCILGSAPFYPNLTTTFSVFSRKTTFIAARSNMSIVSVTSSSPPTQILSLDIASFRAALTWILDFNASGIPPATSIAQHFYSGQEQLKDKYWSPDLKQTFHSLLAFPFWFFNANNLGNVENHGQGISDNLPPEFYTKASLATSYSRIIVSPANLFAFIVLQSTLHLFIWSIFVWLCFKRPLLPAITSYPLWNFASKAIFKRRDPVSRKESRAYQLGFPVPSPGIAGPKDSDVLLSLKHSTHFLRTGNELPTVSSDETLRPQPVMHISTW